MKKVLVIQPYQRMDLCANPVYLNEKEIEVPDAFTVISIAGLKADIVWDIAKKREVALFPMYGRGYSNYGTEIPLDRL